MGAATATATASVDSAIKAQELLCETLRGEIPVVVGSKAQRAFARSLLPEATQKFVDCRKELAKLKRELGTISNDGTKAPTNPVPADASATPALPPVDYFMAFVSHRPIAGLAGTALAVPRLNIFSPLGGALLGYAAKSDAQDPTVFKVGDLNIDVSHWRSVGAGCVLGSSAGGGGSGAAIGCVVGGIVGGVASYVDQRIAARRDVTTR